MSALFWFALGLATRHFLPLVISSLAVLAVKLKRKFRHGTAQWTT